MYLSAGEGGEGKSATLSPRGAYLAWAGGGLFAAVFTLLIWLLAPGLRRFTETLLPDQGASWYYWKLPTRSSTAMLFTWAMYLGHQFSIWAAIYLARVRPGFRSSGVGGIPGYSLVALSANVVFAFLHLVQTHVWFDGLAQDVPIWTSQNSVIIMLAVILVIENPRRGLFLGRRAGRPFTARVSGFFRRNHPYLLAWALVYTFWFHPMASDPQLLSGFLYMFLLLTQLSLAYTPVHLDARWIVVLESYVAVHALVVAVYNTLQHGSTDMWPMFFSGFAFMFVFTQMYALGLNRVVRWLVTASYFGFLTWIYGPRPLGLGRGLGYLLRLEVLWIPIVLYGLAAVFALIAYIRVGRK
jgi:hypothetical protein